MKNETGELLKEIALLLELKGENPFKSRAYYNAARTVEMLGEEELKQLVQEDKLKDVKGIGAAINEKLKELVLTGKSPYYEDLKASLPQGLLEMVRVPGLGPKKVKVLYEVLGVSTLGELEYACKENRLVYLKGFGAKTQANILKGIEQLRRYKGHFYNREGRQVAEELIAEINKYPELDEVSLAGSLRRCKEVVKDIDLVAASSHPRELIEYFTRLPQVAEVTAHGETKATVQLQSGINADLRVVKKEEYPFTLHHFTGSKEHNTAMRQRAKGMDMKMNEYGLFHEDNLVPCEDEAEIFKQLGLSYIVPELRENNGEIEAAAEGELPALVEERDIKGIFHVHTTYSDGANSLEEVVNYCQEEGYEYVGITDHSQSAFYAGGLKEDDIKRQQGEIGKLKEKYPGIGIFSGIESDIKGDGSLDYSDEILESFDFVIASVHSALNMPEEKMTQRILQALTHPSVTMLGHPTGRLLLGREGYSLAMEKVFQTALEQKVMLELNASPARLDLDWRYLKRVKEIGLMVAINPDAHRIEEIKDTNLGVAIARKGWLEKNNIFNTRPRKEVESFFYGKG